MINHDVFTEYLDAELKPILAKHKATLVAVDEANYRDSLITITTQDGVTFGLGACGINNPKAFDFLLKNFSKVNEVATDLLSIESPFYSDVNLAINAAFGKGKPTALAYLFICEHLRKNGKRLFSD